MVSAIRVVSISLDLLRWYGNVLSILSAFCVDVAVDVSDLRRIAVRLIAAANGRMIGHVPCRVEFLVQELILRRVVAKASMALTILSLSRGRQKAKETAHQEDSARNIHCTTSSLGNARRPGIAAGLPPRPLSGSWKAKQPSTVIFLAAHEAVSALP
jgi:hypothetical protein